MESQSQHADEAALVDSLLTAEREKEKTLKRRDKRIRRARAAIVALKRCGYLGADEETRTWS